MRWFFTVVMTVLVAPLTVSAESPVVAVVINDWESWVKERDAEQTLTFAIVADGEDLQGTRGIVRLYLDPDVPTRMPCPKSFLFTVTAKWIFGCPTSTQGRVAGSCSSFNGRIIPS